MKKFLLTTLVIGGLFGTNVMAGTIGTVEVVKVNSIGTVKLSINKGSNLTALKPIVGTAEAQKAMLAILLTAKASGKIINASTGDYNGVTGWSTIEIQ